MSDSLSQLWNWISGSGTTSNQVGGPSGGLDILPGANTSLDPSTSAQDASALGALGGGNMNLGQALGTLGTALKSGSNTAFPQSPAYPATGAGAARANFGSQPTALANQLGTAAALMKIKGLLGT